MVSVCNQYGCLGDVPGDILEMYQFTLFKLAKFDQAINCGVSFAIITNPSTVLLVWL